MQAGSATGTAQGNRDFIARQTAVDAQTADINQRNRELTFTASEREKEFGREQAGQQQLEAQKYGYAQSLQNQKQYGDLQEASIKAQQNAQDNQFDLLKQREGIAQREEVDFAYDQERAQAEDNRLAQSLARAGKSPQEIQAYIDQIRIDRAGRTGAFATGGNASIVAKRPGGSIRGFGFDAARSGTLDLLDDRTIQDMQISGSGIKPVPQVIAEIRGGAYDYWASESTPLEEVQWAVNNPAYPDFIRAEAARAMTSRGDVKYGANQARPQQNAPAQGGGGGGLSNMSNDELMQLIQRGF
ncbi:MAG: hypothetical protein AB7V18_19415 [Pyrinomonadaceae bacterium]